MTQFYKRRQYTRRILKLTDRTLTYGEELVLLELTCKLCARAQAPPCQKERRVAPWQEMRSFSSTTNASASFTAYAYVSLWQKMNTGPDSKFFAYSKPKSFKTYLKLSDILSIKLSKEID